MKSAPIFLVLAALILACGDGTGPSASPELRASTERVTLGVGDTVHLGALLADAGGRVRPAADATWSTLDATRATVEATTGIVTARDTGTARIVVASGALADTVMVTVTRRVASVSVVLAADSVFIGGQMVLGAVARDASGAIIEGAPVLWSTTDSSVLRVNATGALSGAGEGTAAVRVRAGAATAERTVRSVYQTFDFGTVRIEQVALGQVHGCALDDGGRAYCWGSGQSGKTGQGSVISGTHPFGAVVGDHRFIRIDAHDQSSCGLTTTNRLLCWGSNAIPRHSATPAGILDSIPSSDFAVGMHNQACALATDGVLRCWGHNDFNQVGRGPRSSYESVPQPVEGDLRFRAVSLGIFGGCGLGTDDRTYCWGSTNWYQGGNTVPTDRPLEVPAAPVFTQIEHAGDETACGLTRTGEAWCWGSNSYGLLGVPRTSLEHTGTPQRIAGVPPLVRLDTGWDHACGITATGELWCWGAGSGLPTRFAPTRTFRTFATAAYGVCGVTMDNRMLCTNGVPFPTR